MQLLNRQFIKICTVISPLHREAQTPLENDLTVACFQLCIAESPGGICFNSLAISAATVPPRFLPFPRVSSGVTWKPTMSFVKLANSPM